MTRIATRLLICLPALLWAILSSAAESDSQSLEPPTFIDTTIDTLKIPRFVESSIKVSIDGKLDESLWQQVQAYNRMVVIEPDTLKETPEETWVRFFYTDKGLYVGIDARQDKSTLLPRLSSRDSFLARDGFSLTVDPSGNGLYGYWFGVNLGDSLSDGTVLPERQFSNQWNGPWRGASAETDTGWSGEMFIPWSMMTMPDSDGASREIGFYVSRQVGYTNERWSWPALPRTRPTFMSALQKLEVEGIQPKQEFTFYPYGSTTYDNTTSQDAYKAGFDVFWRPTTNLQVTATVNPDFGNVESDNVVVNLTALENFFPEQRAFFLEGQEIFVTSPRARSRGRGTPTTLVNTRRIGAQPEDLGIADLELTDVEENQPSELMGAAKITGQNGQLRYGVLAAFEEDTLLEGTINDVPARFTQQGRDFGVARLLYEDTGGTGRRSIGWIGTTVTRPQGDAITQGIDAHYLSGSGQLQADLQLMFSDVDDQTGGGGHFDLNYTPVRGKQHKVSFDYYDRNLEINDFGFLSRKDLIGGRYSYEVTRSDNPDYRSMFTRLGTTQQFNNDGLLVRSGLFSEREIEFNNNHQLFMELNYFPKRWDDLNSDGNGPFRIDGRLQTGMFWESNSANELVFGLGLFGRQEELGGETIFYEAEVTWRPVDRFSMELGLKFETKDGWLIHREDDQFTTFEAEFWRPELEADFFLSARQQLRVTMQWSGIKAFEQQRWQLPVGGGELHQIDRTPGSSARDFTISRMTFQARYRWEIAPLSDLFVVYTRGSNVDSNPDLGFKDLLSSAWTDRQVDVFVIKLRYRLGS